MKKTYGILIINFYELDLKEEEKKKILGYDEDEEAENIDDEWEDYINQFDVEEQINYYDFKVLKRKDINNVEEKYIIKGNEEDLKYLENYFWPLEYSKSCSLEILNEKDIDDLIINNL